MAVIQSGIDPTILTIDPDSKAARVSLYNLDGNLITLAKDHILPEDFSSIRLTDGYTFYKATTPDDTQPISVISLPLPTNASTETTLIDILADTNKIPNNPSKEHITADSSHAVRLTDGTTFYQATSPSDTQPISAISLPLPTGAATESTLVSILADTSNIPVNPSQEHIAANSFHSTRLTDGTAFYKATTPLDTQPVSVISGGNSLAIDAVSNAARITQYKTDGSLLNKEYLGSYITRIEIIPTTLTAGTTYFTMRNLGSKRAFIRSIEFKIGFSGTAAASRTLYEIERFSSATPTGGTPLTATKVDNTYPASSITDIRFSPGGLTTAGVAFEISFHLIGNSNQLTADGFQDISFIKNGEYSQFVLAINEGLAIRANTAVVLGSYLVGSIYWDERV
jgi:hypothetical protein